MAAFEPKIDSKDFEIASPEPVAAQTPAAEAADLTIRIWRHDSSGNAALTWNTESVLVYMIADLVVASRGRTAVESPGSMAAHFDRSRQALVCAKRIQTAVLEFLACRPGDYVGAAILIHPNAAEGFSTGMAQSALRLAEPGQIILSGELSRRFQDIPGIELRAVPALTTGGTEHAGLAELVWTSAERLEKLRKSAADATPPTANVVPVGATMIVNAPIAPPRGDVGRTSSAASVTERRVTDGQKPLVPDKGAREHGLEELEERTPLLTPSRLAVGAIVLVLAVVGLVLFHPWSGSKVPPKAPVEAVQSGGTQGTTPEPAVSTPAQPPAVVVPETSPKRPPAKTAITKKPAVEKPAAANSEGEQVKKPVETPIQGFEGNSTYDGMTQRDIPRLLQWARSDAGNGNYTKAAQEYRVILYLQPNNADAKEGLRKIQVAQGR